MDIEDITNQSGNYFSLKYEKKLEHIVKELNELDIQWNHETLQSHLVKLSRKYKLMPSKRDLGLTYRALVKSGKIIEKRGLNRILIKKSVRSDSGILNISISMPPFDFSCKYNCYFCPNEPGMPRSYLSNEDVFLRAKEVGFDAVGQVYSRLRQLENNGHPIDKLEFRVLGGTFSSYTREVAYRFIRDLYYAANTYYEPREQRLSIEEEQAVNETAKVHVVGLGIETRPDCITQEEIIRFRHYGVTRVEIGVQHTDDSLLKRLNRGHGLRQSKNAIRLLKDYGFKVEIHIMTDLPGATPEGDKDCYRLVLKDDPDLIPDYLKDYPCLDVDYTKIKLWREQRIWQPYADRTPDAKDLVDVLVYRQRITPPWVRVNRIQRDFRVASEKDIGYRSQSIKPNLAEIVRVAAEREGVYCQCIRCCEIRDEPFRLRDIKYITHSFPASNGIEYFIQAIIPREPRPLLLGFIRFRISSILENSIIPEIKGKTGMVRELHVYGHVRQVGKYDGISHSAQHMGIGKKLLQIIETIAKENQLEQVAVISGIGVRDYYRKRGYRLQGSYMVKRLYWSKSSVENAIYMLIFAFAVIIFGYSSYIYEYSSGNSGSCIY